ncbi:unnamed protein product [Cyprideis torosa]|uniref:Heparan-alpha-glucosaminide N-acetyltransferase n=1 Tax=Cyprideis torosa TaxID=163714 RepID=A0A7R8W6B8_9CRUS|nr:unnamed protein product [Cyprideis torosa]CAG0885071.1 unnamed protein product [Cyprideis torosa]
MPLFEDPNAAEFLGLSLTELRWDQAYLRLPSEGAPGFIYTLYEECHKCPFTNPTDYPAEPGKPNAIIVGTARHTSFSLRKTGSNEFFPVESNEEEICRGSYQFGEFGVYSVDQNCNITIDKEPVNIYWGLLAVTIFFFGLALLRVFYGILSSKCGVSLMFWRRKPHALAETDRPLMTEKKKQRLKSLDTFRGISIVIMIFVNDGGAQYWFFKHAHWNGIYVADLVFPWFMWIMGVCIPMSIRSSLRREKSRWAIYRRIIERSAKLFFLGLVLNSVGGRNDMLKFRIMGVLQRFALCYLVNGLLATCFAKKEYSPPAKGSLKHFYDIWVMLPQWIVMLVIVAIHSYLVFGFPVPNCPTGYLGPGGWHENGQHRGCVGGATGYLDKLILGEDHIYPYPEPQEVYGSGAFDPEGLIGKMVIWGSIWGIAGAILCLASKDDGFIPVNKNLWSLSYVFVTSCFAFFLLAFCYILIDIRKWWNGAPFVYPVIIFCRSASDGISRLLNPALTVTILLLNPALTVTILLLNPALTVTILLLNPALTVTILFLGMNSIVLYCGHQIGYVLFPWHWSYGSLATHWDLLVENLWGTVLWVFVAYVMYWKKVFITV